MLHRNDIFELGGRFHRLLGQAEGTPLCWSIDVHDKYAWPVVRDWDGIKDLPACPAGTLATRVGGEAATAAIPSVAASEAMIRVREKAVTRLGDLITRIPAIYDEKERGRLVAQRAEQVGCSKVTLYKDLRRFFVGGQTPSALLGDFHRCGSKLKGTAGRGRPRKGVTIYQLTDDDLATFKAFVEATYLKNPLITIADTHQGLLEKHYYTLDGNGDQFIKPPGERPSERQLAHFIRTTYTTEQRLRGRKGNKDFEREDRAKLGTTLADCLGVGHYYEADATIADCYLVASDDVREIVGKPTIYIIVDRKSRLIVGWYVGLENPSWACAMLAILSISQDKEEMCRRFGVKYDPRDWPAHMVFPRQFLADRGEMFTRASSQLASELECTVTNVPGKRPDWKPVVECDFKQVRVTLANSGVPGYDPPENATRRQGKHYEKDACLTLKQFTAIILEHIIAHNRAMMRNYDLSLKELGDHVEPSPIALWNHGIVERAGLLSRYSEEHVRLALMPRTEGTVSEKGIKVHDCYYTCPEAVSRGWFVEGRKARFKVDVSYDPRTVDTVYVHHPDHRGQVMACTLNDHSARYRERGFSFAEVRAHEELLARLNPTIEQSRIQTKADLHRATNAIVAEGKKALAAAGKVSRSARKADTKVARAAELHKERQESAARNAAVNAAPAQVIPMTPRPKAPPPASTPTSAPAEEPVGASQHAATDAPLTLAEKIRRMRERTARG